MDPSSFTFFPLLVLGQVAVMVGCEAATSDVVQQTSVVDQDARVSPSTAFDSAIPPPEAHDAGAGEGEPERIHSHAGYVESLDGSALPHSELEQPRFPTLLVAEHPQLTLRGSGDLWPSCWSDDGHLYAAWGDGTGLENGPESDIGVARIRGTPFDASLSGENIATGDAVGQVWTRGQGYTRKPTGIACVNGDLFLAVQDLARDFDDAPAATIARSRDKGRTWQWDRTQPMFNDHELTTIFFLDRGQDSGRFDGFVYAYALDRNWRDSFSGRVDDPTSLWLARVPPDALQNVEHWEWYAGRDELGLPGWNSDRSQRVAVLTDARRAYVDTTLDIGEHVRNMSVLSQGSVVYNAPLKKYIYTSWTEYTFEFYVANEPWGPFRHVYTKDFGCYPWSAEKAGGYAVTAPSKFISNDGLTMFLQSNTFWGGAVNYSFSLRELRLRPDTIAMATNLPGQALPLSEGIAVTIGSSFRLGHPEYLHDGIETAHSEDSRTGERRTFDFWGYEWPTKYHLNRVDYTQGELLSNCGWFETLGVQVKRDGRWREVDGLTMSPAYSAVPYQRYALRFATVEAEGVRIHGTPGGTGACTSISELAVAYETRLDPP